jgi:hypothetical protein
MVGVSVKYRPAPVPRDPAHFIGRLNVRHPRRVKMPPAVKHDIPRPPVYARRLQFRM